MVFLLRSPIFPGFDRSQPVRGMSGAVKYICISALMTLLTTSAHAQAATGVGSDARPVPKGAVRIRVGGLWEGNDRRYDTDSSTPLRAVLATPSFGVRSLPQLSPAQQAIRTLSGVSTFALSLGTLEASGDERQSITPIAVDVGISSRLTVGIVVPYVESRNNALFVLNRSGSSANVGQNPAFGTGTGTTARTANGILLRQLAQARVALNAEITRCVDALATNCDAIRANPTAAAQAVQQALETQAAIVAVYGDSLRGGSPVVPISGSATQVAINARLAALRSTFTGFGVNNLLATSLPVPATIINGPGAINRIAKDTAYGLNYTTVGGTRRAGIGDIDLTASFLWVNTLGARPAQWLAASRFGVRSQVTAGFRFGTAGADRTNDAFDVPIGDGANALLLRSTSDIVFNKRYWISGTARIVQPMGDQVMMRRPLFDDSLLFVASTSERANRSLGRRMEIELAPRVVIGRFLGLSGGYLFRRSDADEFAFQAADASSAGTLALPSRTYQAYQLGISFSTLASYVQGRSKLPLEVLYAHTEPLTGSGGAAATSSDRLELRVYTGFPRR